MTEDRIDKAMATLTGVELARAAALSVVGALRAAVLGEPVTEADARRIGGIATRLCGRSAKDSARYQELTHQTLLAQLQALMAVQAIMGHSAIRLAATIGRSGWETALALAEGTTAVLDEMKGLPEALSALATELAVEREAIDRPPVDSEAVNKLTDSLRSVRDAATEAIATLVALEEETTAQGAALAQQAVDTAGAASTSLGADFAVLPEQLQRILDAARGATAGPDSVRALDELLRAPMAGLDHAP